MSRFKAPNDPRGFRKTSVRENSGTGFFVSYFGQKGREGVNREKLTVKKIISITRCFFHRLCPLQTVKNSA